MKTKESLNIFNNKQRWASLVQTNARFLRAEWSTALIKVVVISEVQTVLNMQEQKLLSRLKSKNFGSSGRSAEPMKDEMSFSTRGFSGHYNCRWSFPPRAHFNNGPVCRLVIDVFTRAEGFVFASQVVLPDRQRDASHKPIQESRNGSQLEFWDFVAVRVNLCAMMINIYIHILFILSPIPSVCVNKC